MNDQNNKRFYVKYYFSKLKNHNHHLPFRLKIQIYTEKKTVIIIFDIKIIKRIIVFCIL